MHQPSSEREWQAACTATLIVNVSQLATMVSQLVRNAIPVKAFCLLGADIEGKKTSQTSKNNHITGVVRNYSTASTHPVITTRKANKQTVSGGRDRETKVMPITSESLQHEREVTHAGWHHGVALASLTLVFLRCTGHQHYTRTAMRRTSSRA